MCPPVILNFFAVSIYFMLTTWLSGQLKIGDLFKFVMQEAGKHFDSDPEIAVNSTT